MPAITRAFDAIDGAFASLRAEDEGLLTISTFSTFAARWLAWRIGGFQMAHSDMAVRLVASSALVDFAADDVDVAVRAGRGGWEGLAQEKLLDVYFSPMCSPRLLDAHGGAPTVEALLKLPILTPADPWWTHWLTEAGVEMPADVARGGVRLDEQVHEGQAALAGQGVAMLTPFFWRKELTEGQLVQPFAQVSTRGSSYWLVYPEHRRNTPKIKRFREWLIEEVRREGFV